MKKIILVVLMMTMTLVAIPCLAQEVETRERSTIEGTLWDTHRNDQCYAFYKGKIYMVFYFEVLH